MSRVPASARAAFARGELDAADLQRLADGLPLDRYAGRVLNVLGLLAEPDDEQEWIVDRIAALEAVAILGGVAGVAKSALAVTFAATASNGGGSVAGIPVAAVRSLVIDGEQGVRVIRRRLQALGVPPELGYVNAGGLDIRVDADRRFLTDAIKQHGAQLVIADSLSRLAAGVEENSDAMRLVVEHWAAVARETGAAVILIAHQGKTEGRGVRGHSAIHDVADVVVLLERVGGDPERRTRRRLRVDKMRLDEEPEDRWLGVTSHPFGFTTADPFDGRERVEDDDLPGIVIAVAGELGPVSKTKLATAAREHAGRRKADVFSLVGEMLAAGALSLDEQGRVTVPSSANGSGPGNRSGTAFNGPGVPGSHPEGGGTGEPPRDPVHDDGLQARAEVLAARHADMAGGAA